MPTRHFHILSALFVTTLIVSNIIAGKVAAFGSLFLPAAVIVFPVSYILSDVLTEVYGYAAMRRVIWLGFACNLVAVAVMSIAVALPSAPFYEGQSAFAATLGTTPRILAASFVAYLVGEFANAYVLAKLKIRTQGKYLWLRTIGSTVIGEGLDSLLFISLAFWGVFPKGQLPTLILTQWLFKVAFETLATPLTYAIVGYLKGTDHTDHYDIGTNFSPIALIQQPQ